MDTSADAVLEAVLYPLYDDQGRISPEGKLVADYFGVTSDEDLERLWVEIRRYVSQKNASLN